VAEELGVGYVSILPSLRGFSKQVEAQLKKALRGIKDDKVSIPVKPEVDPVTSTLRAELQKQMKEVTRKLALSIPVGPDTDGMRAKLEAQLAAMQRALKMSIPTEPEEQTSYRSKLRKLIDSTKVEQKVKVDVDTKGKAANEAVKAGGMFSNFFLRGFGSGLLNPLIGIPVLIAAALALPVVGAAIAAATVLGGGLAFIMMGAFGLRADEELKTALTAMGATANKVLAEAAAPLKGPFLKAIEILSKAIVDMGPTLKEVFTLIGPAIPSLARGLSGFLKSLRETGALKKLAETIGPLFAQLEMALPDIGNAVAQFIISMSKPETVAAFGTMLRVTADIIRFLGGVVGFLVGQFANLVTVVKAVGTFIGWVADGFGVLIGLFTGDKGAQQVIINTADDIHNFAVLVKQWWDELWSSMTGKVSASVGAITGAIGTLPHLMGAALGDLFGLFFNPGRNLVDGLIAGIKSKFGDLGKIASQMAGTIRNFLPFSPAKEGPLSGSGAPFHSGQVIASDMAAGVRSQLPAVSSAADQLAGRFGAGGSPTSSAAPAAGWTIDTAGARLDELLLVVLKEAIRENHGGKPLAALSS
jgi:hypothetical protein